MASRDPRGFVTPALLIQTRHKFRCPKPYEDERLKKKNKQTNKKNKQTNKQTKKKPDLMLQKSYRNPKLL